MTRRETKLLCQSAVHDNFFDCMAEYALHVTNYTAVSSPLTPAGLLAKFFPSFHISLENNQESSEMQWHSYVKLPQLGPYS